MLLRDKSGEITSKSYWSGQGCAVLTGVELMLFQCFPVERPVCVRV
jgi:hypothetical protein